MDERLSERIKRLCGHDEFTELLVEMAERLEGLEAVEPEDTDATIRKLRSEYAEAIIAIANLRKSRYEWAQRTETMGKELVEAQGEWLRLSKELTKAKAEIERLNGLVHNATAVTGSWMARCHDLENAMDVKDSDAELGRLVRGMRPHTALLKTETTYWGQVAKSRMEWSTADQPWFETDPAGALRSIQQVGDDKG